MAAKGNSAPAIKKDGVFVLKSAAWELRVCKFCRSHFQVRTSAIRSTNASGNFCSRPCYNDHLKTIRGAEHRNYNRVHIDCASCGKPMTRTPSRAAAFKDHFCSVVCRGDHHSVANAGANNCNWKGGHKKYRGEDWPIARKRALKRQPFCAICCRWWNLQVHHIVPYRLTQDNSQSNLVVLCRKHHKVIEHEATMIEATGTDHATMKFMLNNILRSVELVSRAHLLQLQRQLRVEQPSA